MKTGGEVEGGRLAGLPGTLPGMLANVVEIASYRLVVFVFS